MADPKFTTDYDSDTLIQAAPKTFIKRLNESNIWPSVPIDVIQFGW